MFRAIFTSCVLFANQPPPELLTTALSVRQLSATEASAKRPIKLQGVVTHATAEIGDCFLQDKTAGIYISESKLPAALPGGLTAGDLIEVDGHSDPGTFAPMVVPTAIRKLGKGPLPDPEVYDLRTQDSRWLDGQYVQVYAQARSLSSIGPFTAVAIVTSAGIGELRIPGKHHEALRPLIGQTIRVRGVCVPKHDQRQTSGPARIYLQEPTGVSLVPGSSRPEAPAPIAEYVKGYSAVPHPSARPVVLSGKVTARISPTQFFLQDDSGGVLVTTTEPPTAETDVHVGERVLADGFLSIEGVRLLLLQTSVKRLGPAELPTPLSLTTPMFNRDTFGRFVRVEGIVEETAHRDGIFVVNLRDGPVFFQAVLQIAPVPTTLGQLETGTRVAVSGVAHMDSTATGEPREPRIYLRSTEDVAVLLLPQRPTWWTSGRVLLLLSGFGGIVALGGLWVWLLRRQVGKQTAAITAQFQREARLNESLRQARKLEAVGRLTAGIAHDFNNLLTVILGNSEMLMDHVADDAAARDMVTLTCEASQRAAGLTRQLLTFSRQTPVHLETLDLNAVVHEAARLLGRVIGEHVRLSIQCAADLPRVRADVILLHQVILNLAANARDAMPRGGDLTFRTSHVKDAGGATVVRLTVSDSGCGMDEETSSHVFEPFYTTKEIGKGTGLGLATVYGAVATLQGSIQVHSVVNQGTTFTIDLPPATDADAPAKAPSRPRSNPQAVILLVDDDDGVRKIGVKAFARYGYTILESNSPVEALELARTRAGAIDLLVSDLIMPGMNGRDMAAIMRITQPHLRVLFITGYPPDEVARLIGDLPDVDIMPKPFTPTELATKAQDILEESSAVRRKRTARP